MDYGYTFSMNNIYYILLLIKMNHKLPMVRAMSDTGVCDDSRFIRTQMYVNYIY